MPVMKGSSGMIGCPAICSADGGGGSAGAAEVTCDAARFVQRAEAKFPFLSPDNIRDANRKRPMQPGYNPRTLHIPPDWFKKEKISEGQRQWWEHSPSQHFCLPICWINGSTPAVLHAYVRALLWSHCGLHFPYFYFAHKFWSMCCIRKHYFIIREFSKACRQGLDRDVLTLCVFRATRWEFKAQHFDSVLLFKMGKFYEMFEMDAHVGAEVLGLVYMKV
jgi:hypothetical protein